MSQENTNNHEEEDEDALPELDEGFIEAADIDEEEDEVMGDEGMEGESDEDEDEAGGAEGDDMEVDGQREAPEDNSLGHTSLHDSSSSVFTVSLHPTFPNPPLAISGGEDDVGFIFNPLPSNYKEVRLTGHTDSVIAAAFSFDGEMAATGGMDGEVRVWRHVKRTGTDDWQDWEFLTSLDTGDEITWVSWHPKGNVLSAGCNDSSVWMWQLPSGNTMTVLSGHTSTVSCGSFLPNGRNLVTTSLDSSLIIWDPRSPTPVFKLAPGQTSNWSNFTVRSEEYETEGGITALAVAPASNLVAVGGANGGIRIVNVVKGEVVGRLEGHKEGESVEALAFVDLLGGRGEGKGMVLVSVGTDGRGVVWDVATSRVRAELHHDEPITSLAPHPVPHPHLLTTASADGLLKTWDIRTGALMATHKGHGSIINGVAVATAPVQEEEDGKTQSKEIVVSAGDDGVSLVWIV